MDRRIKKQFKSEILRQSDTSRHKLDVEDSPEPKSDSSDLESGFPDTAIVSSDVEVYHFSHDKQLNPFSRSSGNPYDVPMAGNKPLQSLINQKDPKFISHSTPSKSSEEKASSSDDSSMMTNLKIKLALTGLSSEMDSMQYIMKEEFAVLKEDMSKKIEIQTTAILLEIKKKHTDKDKIETVKRLEKVPEQEDRSFDVSLDAGLKAASKKERTHSTVQTCNDIATRWKQDAKAWEMCIKRNDKKEAQRLLLERILPDHKMLNKASTTFGSDLQVQKMICDETSSYIKAHSKAIINVYAGYRTVGYTLIKDIVFAVITTSNIAVENTFGYKIEQICIHEVNSSLENKDIMLKEREYLLNEDDLIKAERVMNRHSEARMKRHNNITRISVSWVKSTKFGTADASMTKEVCVTLYVPKKGFIPIEEKLFPKTLDEFPVDVREGVCVPLLGSHDIHENIKIGCAISGHMVENQSFIGTLGGFFEKENQVYGLTCAHVFEQNPNLKDPKVACTWEASAEDQYNYVYQPTPDTEPFGSLVRAVFTEGGEKNAGVDAAIFTVKKRHPNSGKFPDAENDREAGFDENNPMIFHSGELSQKVDRMAMVVKHGSSTGITKGSFRLRGGAIKTNTVHDWGFVLYKQYEIESFGSTQFATEGDSGAMVFTVEGNELIGIGIVEAGMGNVCFVTPIYDVFRALDIPPPFEMKRFVLDDNTGAVCSGESVISNQEETKRLENADTINGKLDNLDQALSQNIAKQMKEQLSDFKTEIREQNENTISQLRADFDQKINSFEEKMKKTMEDTLEKKMDQIFQIFMGKMNNK